jgi:tetratricopeptide (TPR) repeat protein
VITRGRWKAAVLVAVALCLAAAVRETRLRAFEQHRAGQHYEDIYYLPDAAWLPVMSLGFRDALADLIWCKSLVYFGEELGHRGRVRYVFAYTDAVLALDPDFRSAYRWIASAAIYRPMDVSLSDGLRAARYVERAAQRWPSDGELQWDYGSLLRFELAPLERDKQKKRALLEKAAPYLQAAARLGAGPPWLALNNAALLNKLGRTEQAIRQLEELHGTVQDDGVRRDIEHHLAKLRAETYVEALRTANETFERQRTTSYPYLSPGLFFLLGPRPEQDSFERFVAAGFRDDDDDEQPGAPEEELTR